MIYQGDAKEYIYDTPGILCKILKNEQAILEESMGFLKKKKDIGNLDYRFWILL